ncbi:hypothetical protein IE53DRAFT_162640 [Violaceomyces palustris]|uniref:Uncharacterized protein n=1 Tax=Violaceomyces palustris TaxID=1673888 RepID=A0ACD0NTG8_9BASI|nr:hypothetical protein IE53DRAFT_162640 [Violaceomyces palustris]
MDEDLDRSGIDLPLEWNHRVSSSFPFLTPLSLSHPIPESVGESQGGIQKEGEGGEARRRMCQSPKFDPHLVFAWRNFHLTLRGGEWGGISSSSNLRFGPLFDLILSPFFSRWILFFSSSSFFLYFLFLPPVPLPSFHPDSPPPVVILIPGKASIRWGEEGEQRGEGKGGGEKEKEKRRKRRHGFL